MTKCIIILGTADLFIWDEKIEQNAGKSLIFSGAVLRGGGGGKVKSEICVFKHLLVVVHKGGWILFKLLLNLEQ